MLYAMVPLLSGHFSLLPKSEGSESAAADMGLLLKFKFVNSLNSVFILSALSSIAGLS